MELTELEQVSLFFLEKVIYILKNCFKLVFSPSNLQEEGRRPKSILNKKDEVELSKSLQDFSRISKVGVFGDRENRDETSS